MWKTLMNFLPQADILYVAAFAALALGAFAVYERGEAKIVAADVKLANEVKAHNTDLQNAAAKESAAVEAQYETDTATASVNPPHVVCLAPPRGAVPKAPSGPGGSSQGADSGVPAVGRAGTNSIDIGPPLDAIGGQCNAKVKALQGDVVLLIQEMTR